MFLIGIRISPGSTGVYRVDVGLTPGPAVSAMGSTVLAPGCAGPYRVHAGVTLGLPCWHRVNAAGSAVLTPGSGVTVLEARISSR